MFKLLSLILATIFFSFATNMQVEAFSLSQPSFNQQSQLNLGYSSSLKNFKSRNKTNFSVGLEKIVVAGKDSSEPIDLKGSVGWAFGDVFSKSEVVDQTGVNSAIRQMSIDSADRKLVYVNIRLQQFTALENGEIVRQSKITSGRSGFSTVTGKFKIREKVYKKTLRAPSPAYGDYVLDVDYWMPFYQAYGFHDAWWRSSFGGKDYVYNGSHGCVNMQKPDVKWMFNWVNVGTDVYVSY